MLARSILKRSVNAARDYPPSPEQQREKHKHVEMGRLGTIESGVEE